MVNFEWYRTFKAIYQTGTLTGAAQMLLISQPNVSQHLAALEAYVCHPLFERKPRQMVPTEYGKLFYTQIIEAVEKLENVEIDFRSKSPQQLPLTCVAAPRDFFRTMMAPNVSKSAGNLVFEFGLTKDLMEKMNKGEIYFVVSTSLGQEKNIVYEPVLEEKFVLVGSPGLDTSAFKKAVTKGELDKAEEWLYARPWFAYSSDLSVIRRFWLENFRKRPLIRPRFVIPDYDSILQAISAGTGVAIAADYLVKDYIKQKKLKELWPDAAPVTNTIYLAYDKTKVTTRQIAVVRELLQF